ncbi:MAG: VWA domain-containing protein [Ruminococcaceae bacterium]|nr:VWA domain-containing protein [Oscillospiraceae bacterium]
MSWLTPLGFLGLIGLIVLILIYIIKPNYQNKIISSTFVWKLSLKYKKNKIPLNKLRSILLFLCQVLVITTAAFVLAQPFISSDKVESERKVLILDTSVSMMAETGNVTRFEKAVQEAKKEVTDLFEKENAEISIILADTTPTFLVQRAGVDAKSQVMDALDELIDPANKSVCSYGTSDIKAAIKLSEEITAYAENTQVVLYTDVDYIDPGEVVVRSVKDINDWNAAILDVRAVSDENAYRIEIDVACYGKNRSIRVMCDIAGVNEELTTLNLVADVNCDNDAVQTIAFGKSREDSVGAEIVEEVDIYTFDHVYVRIEENDSFDMDNSFYLYGGKKQPLKIQYASTTPNNYFSSALMVLRNQLSYRWDVEIVQVDPEAEPATEGFDFYIFEHQMPKIMPTDGVVLLANPTEVPTSAGFRLGAIQGFHNETPLVAGEHHPIMNRVTAEAITVTRYFPITSADGFTTLMSCGNDPVFIAKNDPDQKLAIMSFSLNFSNLAVMMEFPMIMYNMVEYYMPSTVTTHIFDVGETVSLGARSETLFVTGPYVDETFTEFPATVQLETPGVYTVTQTPLSGVEIVENFYVRIPAAESNILSVEDALENPVFYVAEDNTDLDLLLYLAIALVALLFAEWWLHTREQY